MLMRVACEGRPFFYLFIQKTHTGVISVCWVGVLGVLGGCVGCVEKTNLRVGKIFLADFQTITLFHIKNFTKRLHTIK